MSTKFRDDIQGLRAIAVLSVLLFHVDFFFLPGGFLGVDVFFVISGFLITGNILRACEDKTFTFGSFFLRRFRRLVPAAVATIALSLIAGYYIMPSDDYEHAGRSGLAALLFSSNVVFWLEAGYFDAASHTKPFLHFWSLSVEEQFYLIWPALVLLAFKFSRKTGVAVVLGVLSLASLIAAEIMFDRYPSATFFLKPFRAFEFGIGALVAVLGLRISNGPGREAAVLLGLIMMTVSFVVLDDGTRMPGLLSLIPLFGCTLIILSPDAKFSKFFLENRGVRYVGNASYSIYLVHWPLIIFYKYLVGGDLTLTDQLTLSAVSLAGGAALYHLVETPLRSPSFWGASQKKSLTRVLAGSVCFVFAAAGATLIWLNGGLSWRFQTDVVLRLDEQELRQEALAFRDRHNGDDPTKADFKIYVIGDSFGKDMSNALNLLNAAAYVEHKWIANTCQGVIADRVAIQEQLGKQMSTIERIRMCERSVEAAFQPEKLAQFDLIVLASSWPGWSTQFIPETVRVIREKTQDTPIVLVTVGAQFRENVPVMLERADDVKRLTSIPADQLKVSRRQIRTQLAFAESLNIAVLNKLGLMCPDQNCPIYSAKFSDTPFYYDRYHMSLSGSEFFAGRLRECNQIACKLLKGDIPADGHK